MTPGQDIQLKLLNGKAPFGCSRSEAQQGKAGSQPMATEAQCDGCRERADREVIVGITTQFTMHR